MSVLISWTEARAVSGLAQKPASACRASSAVRRSDLAGRSKKVPEFGDAVLQLRESLHQFGHALARGWGWTKSKWGDVPAGGRRA